MGDQPEYFNFTRDVIDRVWAQQRPEGLALWCVQDGSGSEVKLTFSAISEQARRAAAFFHRLGIQPGDRVLVMLPRVPQWWVALLGLIRLGAVPIPCTTLLTARDIAYRVEAAKATAIITDGVETPKAEAFDGIRIVVGDASAGWDNFDLGLAQTADNFDPPPTRASDPGMIYFTSGTTGMPKMVLHTQASYGLGHRLTGKLWLDLTPTDVHWNLCDTGWAKAAWSSFFGPWHMGACVFATDTRRRFDPAAALDTLQNYPITTWCAPPTALRLMVRENLSAIKLPRLRHCVSAGEPLNPEVIALWKQATGLTIYEGYGQTESVVMTGNFRSLNRAVHAGSMGLAAPGFELGVLDLDLRQVPDGHEGELAVRVKPVRPLGLFQEYWQNPRENAARFRGDWYLTGDMVRRDAEGYFWFVGRADDVIKSSGYRVGPFEVESALIEHPAVLEAAVVGKPDAMRSQIIKAYVVLRAGVAPSEMLRIELQEHCKRITAPYKYPREVEFVRELPKTISGKIRRVELRRHAAESGQDSSAA